MLSDVGGDGRSCVDMMRRRDARGRREVERFDGEGRVGKTMTMMGETLAQMEADRGTEANSPRRAGFHVLATSVLTHS
jgi:hypothetical protein